MQLLTSHRIKTRNVINGTSDISCCALKMVLCLCGLHTSSVCVCVCVYMCVYLRVYIYVYYMVCVLHANHAKTSEMVNVTQHASR